MIKKTTYIFAFLISIFILSSCDKFKSNKPAYLGFHLEFINNNFAANSFECLGGEAYITKVTFEGERTEQEDVSIENTVPPYLTVFSSNELLPIQLIVPSGEYTNYSTKLSVDDQNEFTFKVKGKCLKDGVEVPFYVAIKTSEDMVFSNTIPFTLKKDDKKTAHVKFDTQILFSNLSANQWSQSVLTLENGVSTLVISSSSNSQMFNEISEKLNESLTLTIE